MTNKQEKKRYITEEKKAELQDELDELRNTRRGEIAKEIERAKSMGDLSENAEYQQAREEQASVEGRISEIKYILKNAEIVQHNQSDTVEVGATVSLRKKYAKTETDFQIVGSEETDMVNRKISHTSPLGAALIGHAAGDTVTVETPGGEAVWHIEAIS